MAPEPGAGAEGQRGKGMKHGSRLGQGPQCLCALPAHRLWPRPQWNR